MSSSALFRRNMSWVFFCSTPDCEHFLVWFSAIFRISWNWSWLQLNTSLNLVMSFWLLHFDIYMNAHTSTINVWILRPCLLETCDLLVGQSAVYWMRQTLLVTIIRLGHTCALYTKSCSWIPDAAVQWKWNIQVFKCRMRRAVPSEIPWYFI